MKNKDKLEQYIRKEIESIPYEEEDQMWEDFQKANAVQLKKWNSTKFFRLFFSAGLLVIISGVIFYFHHTRSTITEQLQIEKSSNKNNNTPTSDTEFSLIEKNALTEKESVQEKVTDLEKEENILIGQNTNSSNLRSTNSFDVKKSNLKDQQEFKNKSESSSTNTTSRFINKFGDQNTASFQDGLLPTATEESIFSNKAKSTSTESINVFDSKNFSKSIFKKEESDSDFSKSQIDVVSINSLWSEPLLPNVENNIDPVFEIASFQRKNEWFVKALFSASTNEIYRSALELGKLKKISRSKGLKYGLGFSLEDGYSVSQDSIYYVSGVSAEERIENKDLDYLVSSYLNVEYLITNKRFSVAFGTQISYALFNEFDGSYERTVLSLNGWRKNAGGTEFFNLWTGINRFGVDASLAFSYQLQRFELSLFTSKRITKLIKRNNAQRRKSNIPFHFGASLTTYF